VLKYSRRLAGQTFAEDHSYRKCFQLPTVTDSPYQTAPPLRSAVQRKTASRNKHIEKERLPGPPQGRRLQYATALTVSRRLAVLLDGASSLTVALKNRKAALRMRLFPGNGLANDSRLLLRNPTRRSSSCSTTSRPARPCRLLPQTTPSGSPTACKICSSRATTPRVSLPHLGAKSCWRFPRPPASPKPL
jgi:hypothetical protein